jgi:predicted nucleotidyltransferase
LAEDVRARFEAALGDLVERLERDPTVVAAVLWGSLAYDEVWDHSDIDLSIVRDDRKVRTGVGGVSLTYRGVNIHAIVQTRAEFKRFLQSSVAKWEAQVTLGRILFTHDESLRRIFEDVTALGERDRRLRVLDLAGSLTATLTKVEKWLRVKRDPHYAAVWLLAAVRQLATIDVLLQGLVPKRESLMQAMSLNPSVFEPIYIGLLDARMTLEVVGEKLGLVLGYLDDHREDLFGLLLEYLSAEGTIRSVEDIVQHFSRRLEAGMVLAACEWLADRGVLVKASTPYFLTEHSRVELEQLGFFAPGEATA